jgi:hypothetical protein
MLPLIGFWSGLERARARKRMLALYWVFHTLCALGAALPLMAVAAPQLGRSRLGDELMRQFDLAWLAEISAVAGEAAAPAVVFAAGAAGVILLLGGVFLAGGAVPLLAREDVAYSPEEFWRGAGRNFWPFLRLALYSLIPYAAAFVLAGLVRRGAEAVWGEGLEARPLVWAGYARLALLIVLSGLISTAMDFAKVRLALSGSRQSLRACLGSLRLAWRNPGVMFWLWACFAAAGAAAAWVYVELAVRLETGGAPLFVALVLLQQAYVLARIGLRFAAWGAAAELDPILRPLPAPEPAPRAAEALDYQI